MIINKAETISTSIALDHARQWTITEALRELIQNYIDALQEYKCKGIVEWNEGYATIWDKGPGLSRRALAFGHNDKAVGSIGLFGEGMKSAFATLSRNNRFIEILTGNTRLTPVIKYNPQVDLETLHYELVPQEEEIEGTQIIVQCYKEEFEDAKEYFTVFNKLKWVEPNKISLPPENIYINGSKVGRVAGALFSYHLEISADDALKAINRDRNNVEIEYVKEPIQQLVFSTESPIVIETYLKDMMDKRQSWESGWWFSSPVIDRTLWRSVFKENFPGKYVIGGDNTYADTEAANLGYKTITGLNWPQRNLMIKLGLKSSKDIIKEITVHKDVYEHSDLFPEELKNLKQAWGLLNQYYTSYWLELNDIVVVDFGDEVSAQYDPVSERIFIDRKRLQSKKTALRSLLHETIHKEKGYSDSTPDFINHLGDFATEMVIKYDDLRESLK